MNNSINDTSPTIALAKFLAQSKFEDFPSSAVEHTRRILLDFIGVAIAGSIMDNSKILAQAAREWGGAPEATVIGFSFKLPAPSAGLVNGAIGHAVQMDDTEWITVAHLGTEIIPAAFAVAEKQGNVSGKEIIKAIVLGYEGAVRIGAAVNPSHHRRGFSPNGTLGVFGAAIAAGCILGLSPSQMADAIGSAAMQSSGLEEFCYDGSMSAILNTGHATQAGIISALLAERGFTGSHTILEGKSGFCQAYSDTYDLSRITEDLGESYLVEDVWFKRYPTCAYINSALDIVLDLKQKYRISPDEVIEVIIKTFKTVKNTVNNYNPDNSTAAMLSMPFAVSIAIHQGKITQEEFKDEWIGNAEVKDLMGRVRLVISDKELADLGFEKDRGAIVQIICEDGKKYEGSVTAPRGDPVYPLSDEELHRKYQDLAIQVLPSHVVEKIEQHLQELEWIDDIKKLTQLLRLD